MNIVCFSSISMRVKMLPSLEYIGLWSRPKEEKNNNNGKTIRSVSFAEKWKLWEWKYEDMWSSYLAIKIV